MVNNRSGSAEPSLSTESFGGTVTLQGTLTTLLLALLTGKAIPGRKRDDELVWPEARLPFVGRAGPQPLGPKISLRSHEFLNSFPSLDMDKPALTLYSHPTGVSLSSRIVGAKSR